MADIGHEMTEEILASLDRRIADEYANALRDMQDKCRAYFNRFDAENEIQRRLWESGAISKKEYTDWRYRHMMMGKRWESMRDTLAGDMERAKEAALAMTRGEMAEIFKLNADFAIYQIARQGVGVNLAMYDVSTVKRLLEKQQRLMPGPSSQKAAQIAADKSLQWNRQKIQSAVTQGILQGENSADIAKRLQSVATMNYNDSVRYARTMTTSAQNAGRYDGYRRLSEAGVDLTIEWQATLDKRTRHDHRQLHGQRRDVDEPFEVDGVSILYPAQTSGPGSDDIPQREIWNCRCTLLAWVKGFEGESVTSSPKMREDFEKWRSQ